MLPNVIALFSPPVLCSQCFQEDDGRLVLSVVYCLSQTGRFQLAVDFLGDDEAKAGQGVLEKLEACAGGDNAAETLGDDFQAHLAVAKQALGS
eukprot:m.207174 g.207174  ORF g.207174 m.207174 type:complete len:93 (-) comp18514_c1_seq4:94-372(-)